MNVNQTVDEYLEQFPDAIRKMAEDIRAIIKKTVPEVSEKISYKIPFYDYCGRLIYFGGAKDHLSLYVMWPSREILNKELEPYLGKGTKATYNFPVDKPLPKRLIKKIVSIQARANKTPSS